MSSCAVCKRAIRQPATGRKKVYCSSSCKSKAKRRLESERDRAAKEAVGYGGAQVNASAPDPTGAERLCHVCMTEPATVGSPYPLLCVGCAKPSVDAP